MTKKSSLKLLFTIVLLEVFLQISSVLFLSEKESHGISRTNSSLAKTQKLRIIAIGESTTDDRFEIGDKYFIDGLIINSWPGHLQRILQEKGYSVEVRNLGHAGVTSVSILDDIDQVLKLYQPDIVISMMGINDNNVWVEHKEAHFMGNFILYKMVSLLYFNLYATAEERKSRLTYDNENGFVDRYKEFSKRVLSFGAVHIVMQYPLLEMKPLKNIFSESEKRFFIDNSKSFSRELEIHGYDHLFFDKFAEGFGHTQAPGDILIAQNVSDELIKKVEYFSQSKMENKLNKAR